MKIRMKKSDLWLLAVLCILSVALFVGYRLAFSRQGAYVTVSVDGEIYKTLPLQQDASLDIPGVDGGFNRLEIKDGTAHISEADCPDKLCVHHKAIRNQGETLVCLPHRLIVSISSQTEHPLDDVAY